LLSIRLEFLYFPCLVFFYGFELGWTDDFGQRQKQEQLAMLERENLMISTAFHDQASRLQMNSVVILRRSDNPVSWLNKQRNTLDSSLVSFSFFFPCLTLILFVE
jgi:hypothetical protein